MTIEVDVIGGFDHRDPECKGCGKPLTVENAWVTDGCPCNSPLGINSMNETRWRLLMQLQQEQSQSLAAERRLKDAAVGALRRLFIDCYLPGVDADKWHDESARDFCGDAKIDRATFDELGIGDAT